jgi:hypothetical protein
MFRRIQKKSKNRIYHSEFLTWVWIRRCRHTRCSQVGRLHGASASSLLGRELFDTSSGCVCATRHLSHVVCLPQRRPLAWCFMNKAPVAGRGNELYHVVRVCCLDVFPRLCRTTTQPKPLTLPVCVVASGYTAPRSESTLSGASRLEWHPYGKTNTTRQKTRELEASAPCRVRCRLR